jgi:hypothetical protein
VKRSVSAESTVRSPIPTLTPYHCCCCCVDFETEEGSSPGTSYEQQFLSNLASIPESPFDTKTIEKQERRLSLRKDGSKDEKAGRKALLQKFMETQMHSVVTSLHHEVLSPLLSPPPLPHRGDDTCLLDLEVLVSLERGSGQETFSRGNNHRFLAEMCYYHLAIRSS